LQSNFDRVIQRVFEKAGVEFLDEDDGGGPGGRLKPQKTKGKPK
jgi:hypothetical protein